MPFFRDWFKRLAQVAQAMLVCMLMPGLAGAQGTPLKFNYGVPTADYYVLYVAKDLSLFQKHGLDPQFYWFQSGAPLIAGLKSESLDVVSTGLATAFALGQHIPLKLLFWELDDAAGEALVVSDKSGISSYRDLPKAKAIAAPTGTCAQVSLGLIARKIGVKYSDLKVVNIAPPLYANAFFSHAIDAGIAWAPYSLDLAARGQKIVNWDADYVPDGGVCPVLTGVRAKFLQAHPELGRKLVEIHAEALDAIHKNPQLAINALAKYLSLSPAVAKATYERICCERTPTLAQQIDPDSPYSLTSKTGGLARKMSIATDILYEGGSIPARLTPEAIHAAIDATYVQDYVERQKKMKQASQ